MTNRRNLAVLALTALLASGCVSLLPKAEPVGLYRIAPDLAETVAQPTGVTVLLAPTSFTRFAANDSIMTINGAEAAAIAGARWAAPAPLMFDEALGRAFDSVGPTLLRRGSPAPADQVLRVEVRTFEARYLAGPDAPPTIVVEAQASLTGLRERVAGPSRVFRVQQPASVNRVSAIVEAYNAATGQVVSEIARWTETQAPARPAPG